eukprot:TRINITY_DN3966_c0_g1_i5.p1 TRINITY_DN3966_c0_g1~~TRINITY_DN3966_c0_g1_i5.p1  ORF type:complete len:830 (+),score=48.92 TRINITY_DN3966_c0_g1_i5:114-2603(+)
MPSLVGSEMCIRDRVSTQSTWVSNLNAERYNMALNNVPSGKSLPDDFNVIIEISAHSEPVKYEVDKESGAIFVDRFMSTSMHYPCNYGYIPHTIAGDGDPVDVLVVAPFSLPPGVVVRCRPLGQLSMTDEGGNDAKLLAVPVDKLTPLYKDVKSIEDMPELLRKQISHFFEHYKDLEPGKWVKVNGWEDIDAARKEVMEGVQRFNDAKDKPNYQANMLRIAVAQFNATVGDLTGNVERIIKCAGEAKARGAQVLLTPELALCGYPPEDLLLRPDFYRACQRALDDLVSRIDGIAVIVGHPEEHEGRCYNAATVIENGHSKAVYRKMRLPNYEVFDEKRYFESGTEACVVTLGGVRCGINICADIWETGAAELAHKAGAELLLVLNASPCHLEKHQQRIQVLGDRIDATGIPAVYCNLVGGQDELVFDGASFALDARKNCCMRLPQFEEALGIVDFEAGRLRSDDMADELSLEAEAYQALVVGVRDYIGKTGFKGAIIGLSGGIDSALTLCVAVDALGADKVRAVMMPSPYTAQMSLDDSREMIRVLGVRYDEIPIAPAMEVYGAMLDPLFAGLPADTTEENIQARIRGNILMALSNKTGALVLTTQQVGNGGRLLHAIWRHGRWLCRDQGRLQDPGLSAVGLPQYLVPGRSGHSGKHHCPATIGRVETGPDRSGFPAAIRSAGCHRSRLHGRGPQPARDCRGRSAGSRCAPGRAPAADCRIQASAGANRHSDHTAWFWQGLALSYYQSVFRRILRNCREESAHEKNRSHHQAFQARRSARSPVGNRHQRLDRDRSQRLWPSERSYRTVPRCGICRRFPAQDQDRDRRQF